MNNILEKYYEEYKKDWYSTEEKIRDYYDDYDERGDIIIELLDEMVDKDNKIDNLNGIIDGLEKWLEQDFSTLYRDAGQRHNIIYEVMKKLKELKEGK